MLTIHCKNTLPYEVKKWVLSHVGWICQYWNEKMTDLQRVKSSQWTIFNQFWKEPKSDWHLHKGNQIPCGCHISGCGKVVLVMDNLNIHKPVSLYKKYPPAEARWIIRQLEIHYPHLISRLEYPLPVSAFLNLCHSDKLDLIISPLLWKLPTKYRHCLRSQNDQWTL